MAEASKGSSSRTYKVLKHTTANTVDSDGNEGTDEHYAEVCDIVASSPSQAIRLVVTESGGGAYVAVPHGNWTRERYAVEPQPPKITKVDDTTAAVEPPAVPTRAEYLLLENGEADEQGSLTDAEFEQRKAEIAARRGA